MDTNPMVQGNDSLTDCLNGTFITQNGNEIILQNDMGNARVDNAHLPLGYEPVGIKEYGGIIYVASYNPITNKSQIGSFPSPERIKGTENTNLGNNINLSFCEEENNYVVKYRYGNNNEIPIKYLKNDAKLYPLSDDTSLHIGDKFGIYYYDINGYDDFFKNVSNFNNTKNSKVKTPKNKLYTLSLGILNSQNEFVDITKSLQRFDHEGNRLPSTDSELYNFNQGYFISPLGDNNNENTFLTTDDDNYLSNRLANQNLNTYAYKLIGPLYLKVQLNHIQEFTYDIKGYKRDGNAYLTLTGTIIYNCPDGFEESKQSNFDFENKNYQSYELYDADSDFENPNLIGLFKKDGNSISRLRFLKVNNKEILPKIISHSYDSNTDLYTLVVEYKYEGIQISQDNSILELFLGVSSGESCEDMFLDNLSEWITIDTNLLGSGQLKLTEYKFFNYDDYSNFQYHLEYYEKDDEKITDMRFEFYNVEDETDILYSEIIEPRNGKGVVKIPFNVTQKLYWGRLVYKLNDYTDKYIYDETAYGNTPKTTNEFFTDNGTIFLLTTRLLNPCYNSSNKEEYVRNFKDFVIYSKAESSSEELVFKDETNDKSEFDRRKNAIKEKLNVDYEYVTEYDGELVKIGQAQKNGSLLVSSFKEYENISYDDVGTIGTDGDLYETTGETTSNNYIINTTGCSSIYDLASEGRESIINTCVPSNDPNYKEIFKSHNINFLETGIYKFKWEARSRTINGSGVSNGDFSVTLNDKRIINIQEVNNYEYENGEIIISDKILRGKHKLTIVAGNHGQVQINHVEFCKVETSEPVVDITNNIIDSSESSSEQDIYTNLFGDGTETNNIISPQSDIDNPNNSYVPSPSDLNDIDVDQETGVPIVTIINNGGSGALYNAQFGKIYVTNINTKTYQHQFNGIPLYSSNLKFLLYTKRNSGKSTKNTLTIKFSILNSDYVTTQTITMYNTSTQSDNYPIPITFSTHSLTSVPGEIYDQLRKDEEHCDGLMFNCKLELISSDWYIKGTVLLYEHNIIDSIEEFNNYALGEYKYLPYSNNDYTDSSSNYLETRNGCNTLVKNITNGVYNKYTTFTEDEIYVVKVSEVNQYGCQFLHGEDRSNQFDEEPRIRFKYDNIFNIERFQNECKYKTEHETWYEGKVFHALKFDECTKFSLTGTDCSIMYTKPYNYTYNTESKYLYNMGIAYGNDIVQYAEFRIGNNFYMGVHDSFKIVSDIGNLWFDMVINGITIKNLQFGKLYSFYNFIDTANKLHVNLYYTDRDDDNYDNYYEIFNLEYFPARTNPWNTELFSIDRLSNIREEKDGPILNAGKEQGAEYNDKYNINICVYRTKIREFVNTSPRNAPLRNSSENLPSLITIDDLNDYVTIEKYETPRCLDEDTDCNYYDEIVSIKSNTFDYFYGENINKDESNPEWFKIILPENYLQSSKEYILKYKTIGTGEFKCYLPDVGNRRPSYWFGPCSIKDNNTPFSFNTPAYNRDGTCLIVSFYGENVNFEELKFCYKGNNQTPDPDIVDDTTEESEEDNNSSSTSPTVVTPVIDIPGQINMTYSQKFKVLDHYNSKLNVVEDYNLYPDYIEESTTNGVETILTYEVEDFTPLFIKEGNTYSIISKDSIYSTEQNYITFNQIFKSKATSGDKQIQNGFIRIHDAISSVQSSNGEIANDTALGISYSNNQNKSFIGNFCRELYDGENGKKLLESEMINTYDTKKHAAAFNISEYEDKLFRDLNLKFTKSGNTYNHEEHSYIFSYCFAKEAVYNGHGKIMYMGNSAGIDELDSGLQLINAARIWWRDSNNSWVLIKTPFRTNGLKYHNQFEFCNYLKYSLFTTNFTYCGLQDVTCSQAGIYYPNESDYIYTGRFNPKVNVSLTVQGGKLKCLDECNNCIQCEDNNCIQCEPQKENYPIKFWMNVPTKETRDNIKSFELQYNEDFFDEIDSILNNDVIQSIDINTGNMHDYQGEPLYPGVIYLINGNNQLVKDIDLTNKLLYSPKYKIGIYNGILCNNINYTIPTYTYDFCDGEFSSSDYKYPRIDYTSAKTVSL